jgi:hypothetical protein
MHYRLLLLVVVTLNVRAETHIRQLMTPQQFRAAGLHKLTTSELQALDQWLSGFVTPEKQPYSVITRGYSDLLGASIVGNDAEFLGKISRDTLDPESISNSMTYGNSLGAHSIFNTMGQYGSTLSNLSPFNSLAGTPPRILRNGQLVAYLTKNTMKQPTVDPDELIAWLKQKHRH